MDFIQTLETKLVYMAEKNFQYVTTIKPAQSPYPSLHAQLSFHLNGPTSWAADYLRPAPLMHWIPSLALRQDLPLGSSPQSQLPTCIKIRCNFSSYKHNPSLVTHPPPVKMLGELSLSAILHFLSSVFT